MTRKKTAKAKSKKSPVPPTDDVEKSGGKSGVLVPQPHGGAIKQGGDHERPGRPPNSTRQLLQQLLRDSVAPKAVEVIAESKDGDLHLRAVEMFARHGIEPAGEITLVSEEVRVRLLRQVEVITRILPEEQATALLRELEQVWS